MPWVLYFDELERLQKYWDSLSSENKSQTLAKIDNVFEIANSLGLLLNARLPKDEEHIDQICFRSRGQRICTVVYEQKSS